MSLSIGGRWQQLPQYDTRLDRLRHLGPHAVWKRRQYIQTAKWRATPGDAAGFGSQNLYQQSLSDYNEELPSDAEVVPLGQTPGASNTRFGELKSVAVAGATGGCGRAVVSRLVAERVPVRALVRNLTSAVGKLPGRDFDVELREIDVTQMMGLPEALQGQDCLIIATGSSPGPNPLGPYTVDYQGTVNLVSAAKAAGVRKIVLITSIGTDEPLYPLNLLWGILFWKKRAEEELQRSGIDYTILRPGGLLNQPRGNRPLGGIIMAPPATYGLPPKQSPTSILRSAVADVCVEALVEDAASNRVIELVQGEQSHPVTPISQLFKRTQPNYSWMSNDQRTIG